VSDDKDVRLAQLLLCLENVIHNGKTIDTAAVVRLCNQNDF